MDARESAASESVPAGRLHRDRCGALVCPWCRQPTQPVAVHGHLQCSRCGTNIDPCCGGETAQPER